VLRFDRTLALIGKIMRSHLDSSFLLSPTAWLAWALGALLLASCSAAAPGAGLCSEGAATEACACDDGASGTRACAAGSDATCVCDGSSPGDPTDADDGLGTFDPDAGDTGSGGRDATRDGDGDDGGEFDTDCERPQRYWPDDDLDGFGSATADPVWSCHHPPGYADNNLDCDDSDRFTYPGAPELCDGRDNNCNGRVDENIQRIPWYLDEDGDGFGAEGAEPIWDCARRPGYSNNDRDCDDTDPTVHPGAEDPCNGIDNNCDGRIDSDATFHAYWPDRDGDGFGDADAVPIRACEQPEGYVDNREDCDDTDPDVHPDAEEVCDLIDNNCNGYIDEGTGVLTLYPDRDGDGYGDANARAVLACTPLPGHVGNNRDCNDDDASIHPGAPEVCDGVDNNCNGTIDVGAIDGDLYYPDVDGDGFGDSRRTVRACEAPPNHVTIGGDCDDLNPNVNPDAVEICNGIDDNCNGFIDEGLLNACGTCGPTPPEICGDGLDNNCSGTIDDGCACDGRTQQPCYSGPPHTLGVGVCRGGTHDCSCPGGARFCSNGTWGTCAGQVLPSAEICNGLDDNCNGRIDEGVRNACGDCGPTPVEVCNYLDDNCNGIVDEGVALPCGLCPGDEAPAEICGDGLDNNCNGLVDEGCMCMTDADPCYSGPPATRGVGACTDGTRECYAGGLGSGVCEGQITPSLEICDGIDNTCDGLVDVGPDGCSVCGVSEEVCDGVDNNCNGFVDEGLRNSCGDCIADVVPERLGGPALCDGIDNDCNGFIDEGLLNACGTCGLSCYTDTYSSDADFSTGAMDGVSPNDGLRLDTSTAIFDDMWVANTADDSVTRINTRTGTIIGTYPVGVNAGANNDNPSRTAIDLDGNAWVANRAISAGSLQGSVTKVRGGDCVTGCVEFNVNVGVLGGLPRALAIDADGFVWVGNHAERRIYRLHPDDGRVLNSYDVVHRPYGFAIDREGILWIAFMHDGRFGAFNINTRTNIGSWTASSVSPYGIAVDANGDVWAGNWTNHGIVRLRRSSFPGGVPSAGATPTINRYDPGSFTNTRGVAIDADGFVWAVSSGNDRLVRFNPSTGVAVGTYATCTTPTGVGITSDNHVWVSCLGSNNVRRHRMDGTVERTLSVGSDPYSYSDMTGFQLRNFTTRNGTWRQIFDCSFSNCSFDAATWVATRPPGTNVELRFRSSTNASTWSAWSSYFTSSPATLSLPLGRYLQIEARLTTSEDEVTPVLRSVNVEWQRP